MAGKQKLANNTRQEQHQTGTFPRQSGSPGKYRFTIHVQDGHPGPLKNGE